jgi:hypothetical protein
MINLLNQGVRSAEKMIHVIRSKENELWNEYKELVDTYGAESTFAIEARIVWGTVHNIMTESDIKTVKRIEVENQDFIK